MIESPVHLDLPEPHKLPVDTVKQLLAHRQEVFDRHHMGWKIHVPHNDPEIELHLCAMDRNEHLNRHASLPITPDVETRSLFQPGQPRLLMCSSHSSSSTAPSARSSSEHEPVAALTHPNTQRSAAFCLSCTSVCSYAPRVQRSRGICQLDSWPSSTTAWPMEQPCSATMLICCEREMCALSFRGTQIVSQLAGCKSNT